jgi:hypothetical protein
LGRLGEARAFHEFEDWKLGEAELDICLWKTVSNSVMEN